MEDRQVLNSNNLVFAPYPQTLAQVKNELVCSAWRISTLCLGLNLFLRKISTCCHECGPGDIAGDLERLANVFKDRNKVIITNHCQRKDEVIGHENVKDKSSVKSLLLSENVARKFGNCWRCAEVCEIRKIFKMK